jgi:putative transposase
MAHPTSPAELADWLEHKGMDHVRGAPHHPQTQGKIERWHQTLKNRILLENYFLPGDLERRSAPSSTTTTTTATTRAWQPDPGRRLLRSWLLERERIKRNTLQTRRLHHRNHAA